MRMTIDEAIIHAREVASRNFDDRVHCIRCAEEHEQLAEWLEELKVLRHGANDMVSFTSGNADNTTKAVHGLDIFTKNWCMDCEETEKQEDLVFRCSKCEFKAEDGKCLIKTFAHNHKHDYPMKDFGSMGEH